jgi:hypothetical protein
MRGKWVKAAKESCYVKHRSFALLQYIILCFAKYDVAQQIRGQNRVRLRKKVVSVPWAKPRIHDKRCERI